MFADKISGWKVAGESKEKEGQKWERSGGAQKWWESKSGGGVLSTLIITLLLAQLILLWPVSTELHLQNWNHLFQ